MYSASRYLTACAAVLVATLVVAEPLDRRIINDEIAEPGVDHDVIPVTSHVLDKRIINGQDAQSGSHPYIAELKVNYAQFCEKVPDHWYCIYMQLKEEKIPDSFNHKCGGTLIHESWVLTAAHCVDISPNNMSSFSALKVVLGEHDNEHNACTEQEPGVKNIFVHSGWNATGHENDIALIELITPARTSKSIQIAKLSKDDSAFVNTECVVAGWGTITAPNRTAPSILQEVKTTVIHNDECAVAYSDAWFKRRYKDYIDKFGSEKVYKDIYPLFAEASKCGTIKTSIIRDDHVCIKDRTPDDNLSSVCFGDSGGPLTCGCDHNILVGVASFVMGPTCPEDAPQVYTRVSSYIDFIECTAKIQV